MKKSLLAIVVLFVMAFTLNSCTDNSEEILENAKQEKLLINKDEIENPRDKGKGKG